MKKFIKIKNNIIKTKNINKISLDSDFIRVVENNIGISYKFEDKDEALQTFKYLVSVLVKTEK